jgi:N-acyl amino acid synthase of PEP-CTERM/exosortase system
MALQSSLDRSDRVRSFISRTKRQIESSNSGQTLKEIYDNYFEVVLVETAAQLEVSHRLRYEVYCVENAYEDPRENPGGLERDAYDSNSLHALLLHRDTGAAIGTVRLILPSTSTSKKTDLPIHHVCDHELLNGNHPELPRACTAEISRLSVSKTFRRRTVDRGTIGGVCPVEDDPGRAIINTSFGLMQAIVCMAGRAGITHVCAVMEPQLLRMLRRLGIHFTPLGPTVEYHGRRQPCYARLDSLLYRTWSERPDVWELIADDGKLWPLNESLAA